METEYTEDFELKEVRGGQMATNSCGCACKYANQGGSSTSGNGNANHKGGKYSPGMEPKTTNPITKVLREGAGFYCSGGFLE